MEDSASCVWVSVSGSSNVKGGIADLALVFWDTMPRQLFLHGPHLLGVSMWLALRVLCCYYWTSGFDFSYHIYSFGFSLGTPTIPFIFIPAFPLQMVVFSPYWASQVAQMV